MGVPLTPAESIAISERPTRDLQAFLLYSRGLEDQDRGAFGAAAANFRAASQRDPSFQAAAQQAQTSEAAQTAASVPDNSLAAVIGGGAALGPAAPAVSSTLTLAINNAVPSGATLVNLTPTTETISLPVTDPNRLCEPANCQGPTRSSLIGTIIIIIRRP
jgi:hypothetical protein